MPMSRKFFLTASLSAVSAAALTACGLDTTPVADSAATPGAIKATDKAVTVYTADGLNDGTNSFYAQVGRAFTASTGIAVSIVEAGSGEVVQRIKQESSNPQADVLITLPPFMQQAVSAGSIEAYASPEAAHLDTANKAADGSWVNVVNNYSCMVYNTQKVATPPATWEALLDPKFKGLVQYSTPGVAGDGTAFYLMARDVMGVAAAQEYMKRLQVNNVGPSNSTGQLAAKVDKGALHIANGDVQMNLAQSESMPQLGIFFMPGKDGKPAALNLPYAMGLVKGAPHAAEAKQFIDFLLGAEAQALVVSAAGGFPSREGVALTGDKGTRLAALTKDLTVMQPDWDSINGELDAIIDEWNGATGTL